MANPAFLPALLILLCQSRFLRAEECITGFSVVAPELAVPGKTTAVFVTLSGPSTLQSVNVTLRLLAETPSFSNTGYDVQTPPIIETTQEIKGHGILLLEVPPDVTGSCTLKTLINCTTGSVNDGADCELQTSSQMRLVGPVRDVIIRPAKHAYRPGDTVSFWVLALDHDLQIAAGAIGTVSVKDPQGTKVAIWDQVSLDEGVKSFSLPLSELVMSGRWMVYVEVEQSEFSTVIEVAPGVNNGLPDIAVAEEHYVELRFGKEMRRRYKPGLPFAGKVEAMSTEKSVRVRVKVYDNTTSIYSQDIEISNGEGTFIVPAILADSDIIALQAELVSVESKEIESHYVLAREPIHKWNSSSDCYLLIQGVEHTLQPEETANVAILSTCPCERDLHYVITTDGRVTEWAQTSCNETVGELLPSVSPTVAPGIAYKFNFSFTVHSVMAPVSQLLVYYVTSQGEPVSDVISFDVKLLHRQVYVNLEEREWWLPNQSLDLEVVAEPSSLVCLLGSRSGAGGDIRFDPRISEEHFPAPITGEVDFLEAGLSFFQRQCIKRSDSGVSAVSYRQRGSGAGPSNRRRPPESLVGGAPFEQLWLWSCFNHSSDAASTTLTISTPKESGKWSLWALTVSSAGLRFSAPVQVQVFRPLQVEFHLPSSLRVRETLEVDIKIGNNINSCMDVTALLALSEGAQFLSNGLLYVTERLRLGPHGATSLVVRLLVTTPGIKNMTVEVNGYSSSSCEGLESINNTALSGAVVHSATVRVDPEGIVKTDTESAYFCANENVVISTVDNYKYEWIQAPRNRESIVIEVKTSKSKKLGPLHIALAESKSKSDKMYRITVGDSDNAISYIARGKRGYGIQLTSAETPSILTEDEWRTFWITWDHGTICFGNGSQPHNYTLLKWRMDKKIKIHQIGFASSWGALAEFRVWNFNEESGFSQVLNLDTPKNVVPGSEWGELTVSGGLALPTMKKMEGGGLTGALAVLTPLLTLQHIGNNRMNETEKDEIMASLPGNIQSILSFRKEDNSFSEHQMLGSHRLTVSILEVLTKVQRYFNVDPDLIQSVKRWVQLRQEDDGRFTPLDADVKLPSSHGMHMTKKNLTLEAIRFENIVEITAETVIALYEIGVETDADSDTLQKAKIFLENSLPNIESPETIAAVTLALVLARSATAAWAIEKLRNASTTEDGEFGWPHFMARKDAANWLYESEAGKTLKEPLIATVDEYKASLYALSTFCLIGDLRSAESVTRFLFYRSHMLDKHRELLYLAVKVFSQYEALAKDKHRKLTISLATSGMELTDTIELTTCTPPQTLYLPSLPTKVFVYATGAGCATTQGKTTYSTYTANARTSLLELWSGVVEEILPDRSSVEEIEGKLPSLKIKTCFRWKGAKPSAVLRLEVSLFSGFGLTTTPPQLLSPSKMAEMQHGYHANKLWFIFANVSTSCPICVQYTCRSPFVISSLRPSHARIFPASREDLGADMFFHTYPKSALLNSVTADDMFTWFGGNDTNQEELTETEECRREATTTTTTSTTITSTALPITTTETVNAVENGTTTSVDDDVTSEAYANVTENASTGQTTSTSSYITTEPATTTYVSSTVSTIKENEELGLAENMLKENIIPLEEKIVKPTMSTPVESTAATKVPVIIAKKLRKNKVYKKAGARMFATKTPEAVVSTEGIFEKPIISAPKHVNTEQIHTIPVQFKKDKRRLIEDEEDITFAPEIKNDEFVLLDKEALWGMLKEAVDDEFQKTRKNGNEKINRYGLST